MRLVLQISVPSSVSCSVSRARYSSRDPGSRAEGRRRIDGALNGQLSGSICNLAGSKQEGLQIRELTAT